MTRRPITAALALATALSLLAGPARAQLPPVDGGPEELQPEAGAAPAGTVLFPTDALTVADPAQVTGRRVALPSPDCAVRVSDCADLALVNQLDGFDLLPRVTVQLDAAPQGDLREVFPADVLGIRPAAGGEPIGLDRLVYDPATRVLTGEPVDQLVESTAYDVVYRGAATRFTTMTASAGLVQMRRQLDSGAAYAAAGIPDAERGVSFTQGELRTVFPASEVVQITRYDERVPGGELTGGMVINTAPAAAGTIAFGHLRAPSWLRPDRTFDKGPTGGEGPPVTGAETIGVTVILPAGSAPEGGWPLAIFGPGITRSKYDLFLAADLNAARGLATMSFDPVGHAYGPGSEVGVQLASGPDEVRFSGFGRGVDLDDDGVITDQEGVQAPSAPHPRASVGLRDGLRQTAADLMAVVRAVQHDADVDGDGVRDLAAEGISLYAQSLGGIYSTMMVGADPTVEVAVLNVPGGSILDIASLSPVFRERVADQLRDRVPGLLNGGIDGFDEDLGQQGVDPPTTEPVAGALAVQDLAHRVNWLNRPGSPEAFAPLLHTAPLPDSRPKRVLYQFALGDQTVPNPTSARLARAFDDDSHVVVYRNDLTLTAGTNPHGFLLDPTVQGRNQAQQQVVDFLTSGGATITDPDGPLPTWEVPVADPAILLDRNFDPALYAAPTPAPAREVRRVAGADPAATAAAVSADAFPTAAAVVIARADDYADGLAGGPLAASLGGPLLLTDPTGLWGATAAEVERLEAETAVLLGGEAALSPQVAADLEALGLAVERVAGGNRFATAVAVADRLGYASEVLLVQGEDADPARGWPDALSAAGIAAGLRLPILLTATDRLPEETRAALGAAQDVTVVGGVAAVSDAVAAAVEPLVDDLRRVAGAERYQTSASAADDAVLRGLAPTQVWLATGTSFASGLAAGAAAGSQRGILLLVEPTDAARGPEVLRWLRQHGASVETARVVGDEVTISGATAQQVAAAISG
jgi:putative cell wall-binding protein